MADSQLATIREELATGETAALQIADCYRLLAACFYVPEKALLVEEDLCGNLATLFGQTCPGAQPYAREMAAALIETSEEDLRIDHANLFLGPFELMAPPYGSVYLEQTRRLMGDSTMAVQAAYLKNGLELTERDAPDHIAIELEFLHYLWNMAAQTAGEGQNDRHVEILSELESFLKASLVPWVPEFCQRIGENAETAFYRNLATCLGRYIACATGPAP